MGQSCESFVECSGAKDESRCLHSEDLFDQGLVMKRVISGYVLFVFFLIFEEAMSVGFEVLKQRRRGGSV